MNYRQFVLVVLLFFALSLWFLPLPIPLEKARIKPTSPSKLDNSLTIITNQHSLMNLSSAELIDKNIVRFFPPDLNLRKKISSYHSFAIDPPLPGIGPAESSFPVQPVFITQPSFAVEISAPHGTSFYGAGEIPGRMLLNKRRLVTWNTDNPFYDENSDRAYQAHPYLLGLRPDGTAFGAIFDTSFRVVLDLTQADPEQPSTQPYKIRVESDYNRNSEGIPFSVVVIERESPDLIVTELAKLTGYMPLPPKWSLGYHQCRWSYYPEKRVREIAEGFRARKIPCDVIWLDIHYMNGYRVFTFDPHHFPNPEKLNDDLHKIGFRSVWMIDPGVKNEPGFSVHDQLVEQDLCVKDSHGKNYVGDVWPGACVFPDFTMEETREWWAGLYKDFIAKGVDGVWNDMNEPSVFNSPTKTMPEKNVHRGYGGGLHAQFHNVYGMLMIKGTREGISRARPEKRPFVLSRANYLGGQKYGATWTGDNQSKWNHLHMSISMVVNLGLSGQPFSGPDIGGFGYNADGHLFARWMGFGALLPFARGHTHHDTADHEPWSFGSQVEETCRVAISRRYMLLPYFYTLFHIASETGLPVLRPLFFADPKDMLLREEDRGFLLGGDLMVLVDVNPPNVKKYSSPIAIPRNGKWTTFHIDGHSSNRDLPEMKIRRGSIIPIQQENLQYVDQKPLTELTLLVAFDNCKAEGILYEDEGDGFNYEKNVFSKVAMLATLSGSQVTLDIKKTGSFRRPVAKLKIRIITEDGTEFVHTSQESDGDLTTISFAVAHSSCSLKE